MLSQVWSFSSQGVWDQVPDHALVSNSQHLDWADLLDICGFASQPCCSGGSFSGFSFDVYVAVDGGFLITLRDSFCRYWLILVSDLPGLLGLFSSGLPALVGVSQGDLKDAFRESTGGARDLHTISLCPYIRS